MHREVRKYVQALQVTASFLLLPLVFFANFHWSYPIVAAVLYYYFYMVGMHISNHKYWTHQAFETNAAGEWFMLIASWFGLQGHPVYWGKGHLDHHDPDKVDTDADPLYRARKSGNPFRAIFHNHGGEYTNNSEDRAYTRRILKNPRARFTYKYDLLNIFYPILMLMCGYEYLVWFWAVPVAAAIFVCGIGVIHGHNGRSGYQSYRIDDSINLRGWLWRVIYCGAELENNHHRYPDRCDFALKDDELDIGNTVVKLIAKKGSSKDGGYEQ